MKQKVLLMILDGWGIGNRSKGDVISTVHPAYISAMTEKYPHAQQIGRASCRERVS